MGRLGDDEQQQRDESLVCVYTEISKKKTIMCLTVSIMVKARTIMVKKDIFIIFVLLAILDV